MGVHGLWRLLDTFGEVTRPEAWRGKKVAIDASIWMAQFRAQSTSEEFVEERILEGFFLRILKLLYFGIEPVFVFDGAASYSKAAEQRRRTIAREEAARTLLRRRAREILMAQVSAGQLDVSQLETRIAEVTEEGKAVKKKKTTAVQKAETAAAVTTCEMRPPSKQQPPVRKRPRSAVIAPDTVATASTTHFLRDIHEYLEDQQKGEHQVAANLLKDTSTSLFMGPRAVLAPGAPPLMAPRKANSAVPSKPKPDVPAKSRHVIGVDSDGEIFDAGSTQEKEEKGMEDNEEEDEGSVCVLSQPRRGHAPIPVVRAAVSVSASSSSLSSSVNSIDVIEEDNDYERLVEDSSDLLAAAHAKTVPKSRSGSRARREGSLDKDEENDNRVEAWASNVALLLDEPHLWNPGTQWASSAESKRATTPPPHSPPPPPQQQQQQNTKRAETLHSSQDSDFTPVASVARHAASRLHHGSADDKKGGQGKQDKRPATDAQQQQQQPKAVKVKTSASTLPSSAAASGRAVPFELLPIVELLHCCGISYIVSPSESDAQCAFLSQAGLVDAVFTEDSDVLVHGANTVLRGFFSTSKDVVAYRRGELLACGMDKRVLVAMALLLGCDYTTGVVGVGLIGSLDAVTAAWRQHQQEEEQEQQQAAAAAGRSAPKKAGARTKPKAKSKADPDEKKEVFELLSRWRDLARFPPTEWPGKDEELALLQYQVACDHRHQWATLELDESFPDRSVIDLFYSHEVDTDLTAFPPVRPEWEAMRIFASARGLFKASWVVQRYELAKKTFEARREAEAKDNTNDVAQRRLTEFGVSAQTNEKYYYKKQNPKYAEALQRLRLMQGKK